jgi:DNA repair protein SbcD/Mre11
MIRFVHTADVHYGVENYGRIDPTTGIHTRLLDFHAAFNQVIDCALAEQVDFFLFSGDAYKTAHPSPTQQRLFIQSLLRLYNAKIPVIIIVGNHDMPISYGKAHALDVFAQLPVDGFHVISKPSLLNLQTKSGPITIVGIPWPSRSMVALNAAIPDTQSISQYLSNCVSEIIASLASQVNHAIPAVLAAHLTVTNGIFSGSEKKAVYGTDPLFLPSQLALEPFDYVGLGHLHRHQQVNPNQCPPIVYAGSTERVDFGERHEEKGFCLVTIHEKKNVTYEFKKLATRPFKYIEVVLGHSQQTETILDEIKRHAPINDAVVKIVYHLPVGIKDQVDLQKIESACDTAHFLAGIVPIHEIPKKELRAQLNTSMDIFQLMQEYCKTKPELEKKTERLLSKLTNLVQEDIPIE